LVCIEKDKYIFFKKKNSLILSLEVCTLMKVNIVEKNSSNFSSVRVISGLLNFFLFAFIHVHLSFLSKEQRNTFVYGTVIPDIYTFILPTIEALLSCSKFKGKCPARKKGGRQKYQMGRYF